MKKTLALIFALILCVSFSFTAFAADYTVGADGNAVYESAVGYVFDIEDVNGTINGEDATILTSADGLANCGSWAIWLVAEKVEGSSAYKAVTNLKIGDKIDMEGFLYWYEGVNPHITSITAAK